MTMTLERARLREDLLLPETERQEPFGVYVHWPFCLAKCPYCDFNSHVRHGGIDEGKFLAAYLAELTHFASLAPGRRVSSIFFGGGTPSLMGASTVAAILETIAALWPVVADAEITLEANPTSVEAMRFAGYRAAGINRVSLGVQALDDASLKALGRMHTSEEALAALHIAKRHFERVSFDLIYARQGHGLQAWREELNRALGHAHDHLSLYQLTIEPGTRFASMVARREFVPLDSDAAAGLYELTAAMTAAAGIPAYEISNHARPGRESRHNLTYWRYGDYAGVGPGAHGRRLGSRTVRHRKPENFLSSLVRNGHGIAEEERLSPTEAADEALVMGLRLTEGIDPGAIAERFGLPQIVDWRRIERLVTSRHLMRNDSRIALTPKGRLLLDYILGEIAADEPRACAIA
jgi:putative oxygen-independent coproporphyrinogen III oxidase